MIVVPPVPSEPGGRSGLGGMRSVLGAPNAARASTRDRQRSSRSSASSNSSSAAKVKLPLRHSGDLLDQALGGAGELRVLRVAGAVDPGHEPRLSFRLGRLQDREHRLAAELTHLRRNLRHGPLSPRAPGQDAARVLEVDRPAPAELAPDVGPLARRHGRDLVDERQPLLRPKVVAPDSHYAQRTSRQTSGGRLRQEGK
jgi:hypothetical protein